MSLFELTPTDTAKADGLAGTESLIQGWPAMPDGQGHKHRVQSWVIPRDCRQVMEEMDENSISLILTDPPYFTDGMDDGWNCKTFTGNTLLFMELSCRRQKTTPIVQRPYSLQRYITTRTVRLIKTKFPRLCNGIGQTWRQISKCGTGKEKDGTLATNQVCTS